MGFSFLNAVDLPRHDNERFHRNIIAWLDKDASQQICVRRTTWSGSGEDLVNMLRSEGYQKRVVDREQVLTASDLEGCGVLVYLTRWDAISPEEIDVIEEFVRNGGGVWMDGLGWSYVGYVDPNLDNFPMNQIGERFGVRFENGYLIDPTNHEAGGSYHPIFHRFYPSVPLEGWISGVISFRDQSNAPLPRADIPTQVLVTVRATGDDYQWPAPAGPVIASELVRNTERYQDFSYGISTGFLDHEKTYIVEFSVYGNNRDRKILTFSGESPGDIDVRLTYENVETDPWSHEGIFRRPFLGGETVTYTFSANEFDDAEKHAVRNAMLTWASTEIVDFAYTTAGSADIHFRKDQTRQQMNGNLGQATPPKPIPYTAPRGWTVQFAIDGNWARDPDGQMSNHLVAVNQRWQGSNFPQNTLETVALHEIGHVLGLHYPTMTDQQEGFFPDRSQGHQWSIMTYESLVGVLWPGWSDVEALGRINNVSLIATTNCPVDIVVTDAAGNVVSKTLNQIVGATYIEDDLDADGGLEDQVTIPEPSTGQYFITVVPEPGANPNEPVTLTIEDHGERRILIDEVPVQYLPTGAIPIIVDRTAPVLAIDPSPVVLVPAESWVPAHVSIQVQDETDPDPHVELVAIEPSWEVDPATIIQNADYGQDDRDFELLASRGTEERYYTVMYAATDAAGNVSYASAEVYVGNNQPVAVAGAELPTEEGMVVQFDGTTSSDADGDALTYLWEFGDGTTAAGPTPTHTYADNGVYTVTLTVDDGYYDGSRSDALEVTVENVPPTVTASGNDAVMLGEPYLLTLAASDLSPVDQSGMFSYRIDWNGDNVVRRANFRA